LGFTQSEDEARAAEILRQLGLHPEEALVFTVLSRIGQTSATTIATTAQISRPQAYRALDQLTGRGVVLSDLSRPRLFQAVPMDEMIAHLRHELATRSQDLSRLEGELRAAASTAVQNRPPPRHRNDLLRGRQAVTVHALQMFKSARREINLLSTHPVTTVPNLRRAGGWEILEERAAHGVRVRVILKTGADADDGAPTPRPDAPQVRFLDTERAISCQTVDGTQALAVMVSTFSRSPRAGETVALVSDDTDFVLLLDQGFDAMWAQAAPAPRKGAGQDSDESLADGRTRRPIQRSPSPLKNL
jgi:sugar-specific transcriptional regulator TrmB